jgi:hypothetical protein
MGILKFLLKLDCAASAVDIGISRLASGKIS